MEKRVGDWSKGSCGDVLNVDDFKLPVTTARQPRIRPPLPKFKLATKA